MSVSAISISTSISISIDFIDSLSLFLVVCRSAALPLLSHFADMFFPHLRSRIPDLVMRWFRIWCRCRWKYH